MGHCYICSLAVASENLSGTHIYGVNPVGTTEAGATGDQAISLLQSSVEP